MMLLEILFTLFLVFLNGFFVAAEFAIVKVRSSQIELKIKEGNRIANVSRHITQHLDGYLAATQLGITLASLGLGWVGKDVMTQLLASGFDLFDITLPAALLSNISYIFAFAIITVLHIVFGELAPKSIAIQHPMGTTLTISLPLKFFYVVFKPFIWLLNGFANFILRLMGFSGNVHEAQHSSEELQYLLDQGKESGVIDTVEHELIKNVFDFNGRVVKNIMVPRTKICALDISTPTPELLQTLVTEGYSRVPLYEESIDKIVGIVHAKDILAYLVNNQKFDLRKICRKPFFIPETKKITELMAELQKNRLQIAIVLDEFGGTAGMVTLEDIVEELVGEIQDEYDEEKPIVEQIADNEFVVSAEASVYDINEFLPEPLPESPDYDTLAGLAGHLFGKIPEVGETQRLQNYTYTILKKVQQNIAFVRLEYHKPQTEQEILQEARVAALQAEATAAESAFAPEPEQPSAPVDEPLEPRQPLPEGK